MCPIVPIVVQNICLDYFCKVELKIIKSQALMANASKQFP
jgi:hypothetical protein